MEVAAAYRLAIVLEHWFSLIENAAWLWNVGVRNVWAPHRNTRNDAANRCLQSPVVLARERSAALECRRV